MEQAPVVYGKYQLLELLARGGMAEVFKAKSHGVEGFEKILVIKRILAELGENPQFVEMFINEAKIAVTLSHANIVQVFDLGKADDAYFIAMEFVAGADLATVLRRARKYDKPLPVEMAVFVVSEVAKGLDYAHRRRDADMKPMNIVHRDVSPQNVLLSYEGEVKLTDFGIAKARTTVPDGTEHGVLKGKYAYMAPEQARGLDVDARTDLFALGTVLYEALAGVNPFLQSSTYETLQRVREGRADPLRSVAEHVPEELCAIVERAMNPDPRERHENAGRFYEDLIQFLYASGRRVGAHDLSNYLDALRAASEGRRAVKESDAGLRAAFEIDTAVGRPGGHEQTPAEVPSARSVAGKVTTGTGSAVHTPVARPQAERRDVTAVSARPGKGVKEIFERFGGEVVRESAEAVTALFGRRNPDGRDSEHAARAGLSLPEGSRTIHAGRVLVDVSGELLEDEAFELVVGECEGLLADAEERLVASDQTEAALRRFFELRPRGDVFEVLGERNLTETLGRFVGRKDELRRVGEILAVANKGRQCLLSLVGDAGIGKSRLLLETMRRLRLGGHDVGMYVCKVPRHSRNLPLSAAQEMLRVLLGIEDFDSESEVSEKVQRLRELGMPAAELNAVSTTLGILTSTEVPVDGRRPLFAAIARIALKLAEDRLTIFAFDDFQEVDDESLALLEGLVTKGSTGRIVIVAAYRTDRRFAWSELPNSFELQLGPLSDEDMMRLTAARLGSEEVPSELLREVSAKSAGNPLYAEEYVQALLDAEAIELTDAKVKYQPDVAVEVPKTLRGIVAQRLSRVTPQQRHLLQVAAMVGGRFHDALLARVTYEEDTVVGGAVESLVQRGILVRTHVREYGFAHHLIPEVVKSGLPIDARREIHAAIGKALEDLYPNHIDDLAERLAFHYREAGQRPRALEFLIRAADRLEGEHNLSGAIGFVSRAIEMLAKGASLDRDRLLQLYRRIGDLCLRGRELDQGLEHVEGAIDLAEGLGREDHLARFSLMKGQYLVLAQRIGDAENWFGKARQVAKTVGNRDLLRDVTTALADAYSRNGEYAKAVTLLQEALSLAQEANDPPAQIRCLIPLAHAYGGGADPESALQALAEARRLMGSSPERITECEVHKTEALVHYYAGDVPRALESGYRGLELAKEYGFPYEAVVNAHNVGELHMREGDYKRAFAMLRYSYDVAKDHGFVKLQYGNLRVLGFIDAVKLGSPEGRSKILEAYIYAQRQGYVWDVVQARYMLAIVDITQGETVDGRRGLREVLQLAAENGMSHYERAAEEALAALDAGLPVPMPH
ncbi:MAG: protein kinase [Myxococcota bacterium]